MIHSTGQSVCYKVKRFRVLPTLNQASSRVQKLEKEELIKGAYLASLCIFKWPKCKRYDWNGVTWRNGNGYEFFSISRSKSQNLFICNWEQSFQALAQKCYLNDFLGTCMLGTSCFWMIYSHGLHRVSSRTTAANKTQILLKFILAEIVHLWWIFKYEVMSHFSFTVTTS